MRLFVAVDPPESLKHALEREVVAPLRVRLPGASWTRPEGRHVTLKFLGEVDGDRVDDVRRALAAAAAGGTFEASLDELGAFPNPRRARVLWAGVGPGGDRLASLAGAVDAALEPLGFPRERRAFGAHLTLARFRTPGPVGDLLAVSPPRDAFGVDEVVLFRSQLRRTGAEYTRVDAFGL